MICVTFFRVVGIIFVRGGIRLGSGRPFEGGTTVVRVPNGCLSEVRAVISNYRSKASRLPSEPLELLEIALPTAELPIVPVKASIASKSIRKKKRKSKKR
ncbi:MAG: hypothetical protein ACU4EQ_13155 [Candidatus Nitrosoglobus sp.]